MLEKSETQKIQDRYFERLENKKFSSAPQNFTRQNTPDHFAEERNNLKTNFLPNIEELVIDDKAKSLVYSKLLASLIQNEPNRQTQIKPAIENNNLLESNQSIRDTIVKDIKTSQFNYMDDDNPKPWILSAKQEPKPELKTDNKNIVNTNYNFVNLDGEHGFY